ncbi:MAG TPA: GNAT family N-acetyltransferase [Candidatus Angelobacter sp.]|nr:GNAT family N-acetyltransferase [Candidatus Angelobacter sp.]
MTIQASRSTITIRGAVSEDAEGITRTYLESAEHHASLDSELYRVPTRETIAARYREGRQHPLEGCEASITLVAELSGEIVGFIDARLFQPQDAMYRETVLCLISEIAVSRRHQKQGIGGKLLQAAEDWGREQGAEFAILEYHPANTRAGRFYQRHRGYRISSLTAIKRLE